MEKLAIDNALPLKAFNQKANNAPAYRNSAKLESAAEI